jgi:hypothetical protein
VLPDAAATENVQILPDIAKRDIYHAGLATGCGEFWIAAVHVHVHLYATRHAVLREQITFRRRWLCR